MKWFLSYKFFLAQQVLSSLSSAQLLYMCFFNYAIRITTITWLYRHSLFSVSLCYDTCILMNEPGSKCHRLLGYKYWISDVVENILMIFMCKEDRCWNALQFLVLKLYRHASAWGNGLLTVSKVSISSYWLSLCTNWLDEQEKNSNSVTQSLMMRKVVIFIIFLLTSEEAFRPSGRLRNWDDSVVGLGYLAFAKENPHLVHQKVRMITSFLWKKDLTFQKDSKKKITKGEMSNILVGPAYPIRVVWIK